MDNNKLLNTNPKFLIAAGLAVVFIFFGGLAVWSLFFPFEGAVIASGTVKVDGKKKVVQHLEGGIIDSIYVKEGDFVKKGELLIKLKSSQVTSNVEMLQGRLWTKLGQLGRLNAELSMKDVIEWPELLLENKDKKEVQEILEKETEIFKSRRSALSGEIALYNSQIIQLENRIEGVNEELLAHNETIDNFNEELDAKKELLKDNYVGKVQILELERRLSEYKGKRGRLKQDIAELHQKIEEFKLRIENLKNNYREEAVGRMSEVKDVIFEVNEQIKPYLDARERLEVRAPLSGQVINLMVNTEESGVIRPGMPLLEIIPENTPLVIYGKVNPKDITVVKKDQKTKVQLVAFKRDELPPLPAKVSYVSADLKADETPRGSIPYYEVHVKIDPKVLEESSAYLSPGMPVVCYITTDKRNIMSYILDPLLRNVDMAMRE
ncbi:MAG: HlyD family type I secretion periplasmic adaptor subunit [Desulfobacteraceae bacterium]|nr:HlyD family type I secretion periplasmic adaptor subunit [Desulfobacteraceae bacterium]MCB9494744.1 HlyD family type I secretion periplasmic adaptor subunit [Desulfobacteraceae bacterium]